MTWCSAGLEPGAPRGIPCLKPAAGPCRRGKSNYIYRIPFPERPDAAQSARSQSPESS